MGFKAVEYERELHALVERATSLWRSAPARPLIYTVSIWTDPNAGRSAVSFDTRANSNAKVEQSNAWSKTQYDRLMEEGETEEAELFLPNEGRNTNPADFAFRNLVECAHSAFPDDWEETSEGRCWNELEPLLLALGKAMSSELGPLGVERDAEIGVNSRRDWYDKCWRIRSDS